MPIEQIVRPWQRKDLVRTTRLVVPPDGGPVAPAFKQWGSAGTVAQPYQIDPTNFGIEFTVKKTPEHKEKSRTTEKVRVENPDDPNQFVIVERVKKITFNEKKAPTLHAVDTGTGNTSTVAASPHAGSTNTGNADASSNAVYMYPPGATDPTFVQYSEPPVTKVPDIPLKQEDNSYELDWSNAPGTPVE